VVGDNFPTIVPTLSQQILLYSLCCFSYLNPNPNSDTYITYVMLLAKSQKKIGKLNYKIKKKLWKTRKTDFTYKVFNT